MAASRIKGITVEIGGDTTKLQSSLKDVNDTIKKTQSELKDVNNLLKLDPGNTELIAQKQKYLAEEIGAVKDKLEALKEAARQANEQLANGKISQDQYDALQREIADTTQQLKQLEDQAKQSADAVDSIAETGTKLQGIGSTLSGVGSALTVGVTAPLVAIGTKATNSFAEVDRTMQLANKTMGNSAEQAQMLDQAMKSAAANSTFGMSEAAGAVLNFARSGMSAEAASSALAPAMNLAAGEGGNLNTVSAGLVATINGFHGSFEETAHYADVFATACNNSALDVDSLSGAMSVAAPLFSTLGYSVEDASALLGKLADNGIDAKVAATSLKTGFARLVAGGGEVSETLEALGVTVVKTDGSMRDATAIQKDLHDAFQNLSASEQTAAASAIFGKEQMTPWLALINTAPGDVGELDEALANCSGTTDEMADAMMSGFGGSLESISSSMDVLMTSLGQALAPTVQKVADAVKGVVDWFNSLSPSTQTLVANIGLVIAAVGPVLVIVGKIMSAVGTVMTMGPQISAFFAGISGGASGAGGVLAGLPGLLTNPITIIIGLIAAVALVVTHLWKTNEDFRNKVIEIWGAIKDFFSQAWEAIKGVFSGAMETIKGVLDNGWAGIKEAVSSVWNGVKETVTGAWETIKNAVTVGIMAVGAIIEAAVTIITLPFQFIWENCKEVLTAAWDAIKDAVTTALSAVGDAIKGGWDAVKSATTAAWDAVKGAVTAAWDAVKGAVTTAASAVKEAVSNAWSKVKEVTSSAFNAVKETASNAWNAVKTTVTNALNSVKNAVSNGLNAVKTTAANLLEGIKSKFKSVFDNVWNFVSGVVGKLKSIFNFNWSLPKIKLPHFKITGKLSLNPPQVPHLGVEWYKKAMENGMILNGATIFGSKGGKLLGGGEAGPEAVVGVGSLSSMIRGAVASAAPSAGSGSACDGQVLAVLQQYLPYLPALANMTVALDSGALVGKLAPEMNRELGAMARRERRQ